MLRTALALLLAAALPVLGPPAHPAAAQVGAPAPSNDHEGDRRFDLSAAMAKKLRNCPDASPNAVVRGSRCSGPVRRYTVMDAPGERGVIDLAAAAARAPLQITNSYLAVTTRRTGRYHGLVLDGLRILESRREGVRLEGDVADLTIRDFDIRHVAAPNRKPDLPTGLNIRSGTNILIEDGHISGNRMTGVRYPNGDGLNIEKGVSGVTIRRVVSEDHSDSAFDLLKGRDIRLEDVVGRNAARCVKTGAVDVVVTTITCVGTRTAIELHGHDVTIDTLIYDPGARTTKSWLFSAEVGAAGNASLTVKRCVAPDGGPIRLPSADSIWLAKGPGVTVNLGPTCRPPRRSGVSARRPAPAGRLTPPVPSRSP